MLELDRKYSIKEIGDFKDQTFSVWISNPNKGLLQGYYSYMGYHNIPMGYKISFSTTEYVKDD